MATKPPCRDYILATIQRLRMNPSNITPGTKPGTGMSRVYNIVKDAYDDGEIRHAIKSLLKDKTIILIARSDIVEKTRDGYGALRHADSQVYLESIPYRSDPIKRPWYVDLKEKNRLNGNKLYERISKVTMYIVTDGLPKTAAQLKARSAQSVRQEILNSLHLPKE